MVLVVVLKLNNVAEFLLLLPLVCTQPTPTTHTYTEVGLTLPSLTHTHSATQESHPDTRSIYFWEFFIL